MILIPDLGCGGHMYDSTVAHYKSRYRCYVLTLPGCAGQPSIKGPILPRVRDDVIAFIADKHLAKPVILGEGLGGFLGVWIASLSPASVGKLVCIETFLYSRHPEEDRFLTPKEAATEGDKIRANYGRHFEREMRQVIRGMALEPKSRSLLWREASRSDPKSVGQCAFEQETTDLRPLVKTITAPSFFFYDFHSEAAAPADFPNYWMNEVNELKLVPHHKLEYIWVAKMADASMLNDPQEFFEHVDRFLRFKR